MWQTYLLMLLPIFLTIIFIFFTVKASRWEDRKSFFVLLIFNIFLAIFSFLVIFGVYKIGHQVMIIPTGRSPGDFPGLYQPGFSLIPFNLTNCILRTPPVPCYYAIYEWGYLALISEILSILTFVIGLVYYFIKRSKMKKNNKEQDA